MTRTVVAGLSGIGLGLLSMLIPNFTDPRPAAPSPQCAGTPRATLNATVTITESDGFAAVSAQADASLTGVRNVSAASIERCVFTNGGIAGFAEPATVNRPPPQLPLFTYTADAEKGTLSSNWASTPVEITEAELGHDRPPEHDSNTGTPVLGPSTNTSAFVARMDGTSLDLDLRLCRHPTPRWGCAAWTSGEIRLTVADSVRPRNSTLQSEPQPTAISHDDAKQTTTWVWQYESGPPPISAHLALTREFAAATLIRSRPVSNDIVPIGDGALRVNWLSLIMIGSDLLLVAVLWFTQRWSRRAAALGVAVAVATVALTVRPTFAWLEEHPVLDEAWTTGAWCLMAVAIASSRFWPPTTGPAVAWRSLFGFLLVLGGLTSIGAVLMPGLNVLALPLVLTVGVWATGGLLYDGIQTLFAGPDTSTTTVWNAGPAVLAASEVAFAFALGLLIGNSARSSWPYLSWAAGPNLGWVFLSAVPALIAAYLVQTLARRETATAPPAKKDLVALALLFAAVAELPDVFLAGLPLPGWILAYLIARVLFLHLHRRRRVDEVPDHIDPGLLLRRSIAQAHKRWRWSTQDTRASEGEAGPGPIGWAQIDLGRTFLEQQPQAGWFAKVRTSAVVGCFIAIPLLAYYTWTIAQSLSDRFYANGMLYFVVGTALQLAHWVGLAAVFGAVYRYLPTRTGATKAAFLAGVWSTAALASELFDRWLGGGPDQLWLYTTLQIFLYLVVVGVLTDIDTVRSAGGSWRRINELYRIRSLRQQIAYLGPLALAVIGLIIQVRAGAGEEAAAQFVDGLKAAVGT